VGWSLSLLVTFAEGRHVWFLSGQEESVLFYGQAIKSVCDNL